MDSSRTGSGFSAKYKVSRLGRKIQYYDEQRLLAALPKDVPERTWYEILQKEEQDLIIFEMREEIVERALDICYEAYMERQTIAFTVHCTAKAWLKIIDWHFLRHDPGEDPSAYPPCDIPNRTESWIPDLMPVPSPKDSWALEVLPVADPPSGTLSRYGSNTSLEYPEVAPIPSEYWFPGKVEFPGPESDDSQVEVEEIYNGSETLSASTMAIDSEMLEKVTEYNREIVSTKVSVASAVSRSSHTADGAGGDAVSAQSTKLTPKKLKPLHMKEKKSEEIRPLSKTSLPPLKMTNRADRTRSLASTASENRLRNLRLDTQFEVSSEKFETLQEKNEKSPKRK